MSSAFNGLDIRLRPYAQALIGYFPRLRVTSVYRSYTEQSQLYRSRPKNPCPSCPNPTYPVAPPGRSYHEYGRAWDMVGSEAELRNAGAIWKSWGGTWSPKDPIHFQA